MPPSTGPTIVFLTPSGQRRVPGRVAPPTWAGAAAAAGAARKRGQPNKRDRFAGHGRIVPIPANAPDADDVLDPLHRLMRALIPGHGRDLTLRQLAVLLLVCDGGTPRTCCALAEMLAIPRPAMTRALDRLTALDLVRRETDPACRRNVLVQPTAQGRAFVGALRDRLARLDAC